MNEDNKLLDNESSNSPQTQETLKQMEEVDQSYDSAERLSVQELLIPPLEVSLKSLISDHDIDLDSACGIGCFKLPWLQSWATAKVYLVLYSILGILNGCYFFYLISVMSTLEKRFAFKSQISGWILVMDRFTPLLLGVLVGYFGGVHRPRTVAFGMLLSSLGCFICALPYFLYGAETNLLPVSSRNSTDFGGCESERKPEDCGVDRPPTIAAILLLVLGSFLKGCGTVPCTTVGMSYMDDNVKKEKAPMYFGIISTSWMLGPLLGYLMSYSFLKYYEDPSTDPGFGPQDPLWIGRWWAGFVLQGVLLIGFAVPFALFPRWLPGRVTTTKVKEGEGIHLTGLWAALKRLGKNPIFMLLIIYDTFWFYGGYGHSMMLPKYMENQFRLSASEASILSGTLPNSAFMVAAAIGGYLISKFKPNAKYLTGSITVLQVIRTIGFFILMLPKCEILQMTNYGLDEQGLILEGPCNTNCSCTTSAFTPVCSRDGKNETIFFSPCYAGCHGKINETFTNCSCLDSYGLEENYVTEGFCFDHGCWTQALVYTITLPIIVLIVNLLNVANQIIRLRCIKTEDKSVALGTFEALTSLFALFSMFLGAVVDSACLVWEKSCGQTGNCWFYDITKFNYLMHGMSALFTGLAAISMFSMFCLSERMNDLYKEGDDS